MAALALVACGNGAGRQVGDTEPAAGPERTRGSMSPTEEPLRLLNRLSLDVRLRPLGPGERSAIRSQLDEGDLSLVYKRYLDRWLDRDALRRVAVPLMPLAPGQIANGEMFFHRLSRFDGERRAIYFLRHAGESPGALGHSPCSDTVEVRPWWDEEEIALCADSYRPEKVFDESGYCSGREEPVDPRPPRPGCGCGPRLIGCLPPRGEDPNLDRQALTGVFAEHVETMAKVLEDGQPLGDFFTLNTTWQTGMVEFLYARRGILGELWKKGYGPEQARMIDETLSRIDVRSEGRWVERDRIYEGTGAWFTSIPWGMFPTKRNWILWSYLHYLCNRTFTNNVQIDVDAVIAATEGAHAKVRFGDEAPMRFMDGCDGCHAPLDGPTPVFAMLHEAAYGGLITGDVGREGSFYVDGPLDLRAKGSGMASISEFLIEQPEFESCATTRAFEIAVGRAPRLADEKETLEELRQSFAQSGHDFAELLRNLYLSDVYLGRDIE